MPVKIKRILYATDLSETSARAYLYAMKIAKAMDAKIVILHVVEKLDHSRLVPIIAADIIDKHYEDFEKEGRQLIKDRVENLCITEFKDDPECVKRIETVEIAKGHPFDEILNKADQFDCDVIVMGTHGKGVLTHTLLGSVAERVLRHSRKPVMVVPI